MVCLGACGDVQSTDVGRRMCDIDLVGELDLGLLFLSDLMLSQPVWSGPVVCRGRVPVAQFTQLGR
jgi:hypothetical protein